jgi:ribosome-binding protein aMBF1 (putative translation factor)
MRENRSEKGALDELREKLAARNPQFEEMLEEERANSQVAREIYRLRTEAGLTQRQLAERIGSQASVICRLEDADYEGHSLAMLRRIAAAVGYEVNITFDPIPTPSAIITGPVSIGAHH